MAFIALISRQEKIKYSGMDNLRNFNPNVNARCSLTVGTNRANAVKLIIN